MSRKATKQCSKLQKEAEIGMSLSGIMGLTDGKTETKKGVRELEALATDKLFENMQVIRLHPDTGLPLV